MLCILALLRLVQDWFCKRSNDYFLEAFVLLTTLPKNWNNNWFYGMEIACTKLPCVERQQFREWNSPTTADWKPLPPNTQVLLLTLAPNLGITDRERDCQIGRAKRHWVGTRWRENRYAYTHLLLLLSLIVTFTPSPRSLFSKRQTCTVAQYFFTRWTNLVWLGTWSMK